MRRVVAVECPGMFANGLFMALFSNLPDHEIVFAPDLVSACRHCEAIGVPELMLVDMTVPGVTWASLRVLRKQHPQIRVLAICQDATRTNAIRSFENGLVGCVSKAQSAEEIIAAIKAVLSNRTSMHPVVKVLSGGLPSSPTSGCEQPALPNSTERDQKLTPRQLDLLPLLAAGKSNKEIARVLKISENTVKIHLSSLLRVLGVRNRTEVAVIAAARLSADKRRMGTPKPEPRPLARRA